MSINWNGSNNGNFANVNVSDQLTTNLINEFSSGSGVTIEGNLHENSAITFGGANQSPLGIYEEYTNPSDIQDNRGIGPSDSGEIAAGDLNITKIGNLVCLKLRFNAYNSPTNSNYQFDLPSRFLMTGTNFVHFVGYSTAGVSTNTYSLLINNTQGNLKNVTNFSPLSIFTSDQFIDACVTYIIV